MPRNKNATIQIPQDTDGEGIQAIYPGSVQNVSFSGTSAQSSALGASAGLVRLVSTQDCYVAFGENPTATSSSMLLPANSPEYFGVDPSSKIAVLQVSDAGTLNITEAK